MLFGRQAALPERRFHDDVLVVVVKQDRAGAVKDGIEKVLRPIPAALNQKPVPLQHDDGAVKPVVDKPAFCHCADEAVKRGFHVLQVDAQGKVQLMREQVDRLEKVEIDAAVVFFVVGFDEFALRHDLRDGIELFEVVKFQMGFHLDAAVDFRGKGDEFADLLPDDLHRVADVVKQRGKPQR